MRSQSANVHLGFNPPQPLCEHSDFCSYNTTLPPSASACALLNLLWMTGGGTPIADCGDDAIAWEGGGAEEIPLHVKISVWKSLSSHWGSLSPQSSPLRLFHTSV